MTEDTSPQTLNDCVRAVWRRGQVLHLSAGMLSFFAWAVPLFLVAVAIDWMLDLPRPVRVILFVALVATALYKAWRRGWHRMRAFSVLHTALQIETHHGGLESVLVSAVQFQSATQSAETSDSLRAATCRQAEQAAAALRPQEVVRYHELGRPLAFVLILAVVIGAFGFVNGPFFAAGLGRIFPPWLAIDYPTRTQVESVTGDVTVQEGKPVLIQANVSGVVPKQAELALRTGTGKPRIHKLPIAEGKCEYTIDSAYRGFEYRILAGDDKTEWQAVEVIASPRIEHAKLKLDYPEYTQRAAETVHAMTVSVPEATNISWQLDLDRPVREAVYTPAGADPQHLTISQDGRTVTMTGIALESRSYRFAWVDKEHGYSFVSSSHYLQVTPDQAPRVEITSPKANLYATLGRPLALAYRGRDDHGIGQAAIGYRVNKIAEQEVALDAPTRSDGSAQTIDWDYRAALPDLKIGDSVSFVIELTDRYPGAEGPHTARSQSRRITFLSEEDYLAHIARQKKRLLAQLRAIYREQRAVHQQIRGLNPDADTFVQTCQTEAVRQDLMRERLGALKQRMQELIDDLAANNITDETETALLARLSAELERIAQDHIGKAAGALRELAAETADPDPSVAVGKVDRAARELAGIVLQMGFQEATEVMARELHAVAETQADIRLQALLSDQAGHAHAQALAVDQERLAQWLERLFAALPADKESTIDDALVAFNLSRLIKELREQGAVVKMLEAASHIRTAGTDEAAALQAGVIKALLRAEFRLRIGAEYEALRTAGDLFAAQVRDQAELLERTAALTPKQLNKRRAELGQAQVALHMRQQLLLMPEIPAPRPRLFDAELPARPPVEGLLARAESAMEQAAAHLHAGEGDLAVAHQRQAHESFAALAEIVRVRIGVLGEAQRLAALAGVSIKQAMQLVELEERQLVLIEKTEDAADDESGSASLVPLAQQLVEDVERFKQKLIESTRSLGVGGQELQPLLASLDQISSAMTRALPALKANAYDDAIERQEEALEGFEAAARLFEVQQVKLAAFASTLDASRDAAMPIPYVADIRDEQRDLIDALESVAEDELPHLAIVQKNLIHSVNAVLAALDPLSHQIESGTVFLFAKDDMDAAAIALMTSDLEEAADAGSFVAESLQGLLLELETLSPQYSYIVEVTEFFNDALAEALLIQSEQRRLFEQLRATPDEAPIDAFIEQLSALEAKAKPYRDRLGRAAGQDRLGASAGFISASLMKLKAGDRTAALAQLRLADGALHEEAATMLNLVELLPHVLKPPPAPEPTPEALLVLNILALASDQKVLYRQVPLAETEQTADFTARQRALANRCETLSRAIESHSKAHQQAAAAKLKSEYARSVPISDAPSLDQALRTQEADLQAFFTSMHAKVLEANQLMNQAASRFETEPLNKAVGGQHRAEQLLRHVMLAYTHAFLVVPGPPGPADPIVTDPSDPSLEDGLILFAPGAVSGEKPKGSRQEWQVLGRRDRAALNENFARELPLEYRSILKDYYERLAR